MDKFKTLSGEELVAKGATKLEVTLPDVGLKDVTPNGSWLEQKQVQSALEARKHLVEVPRIDKSGSLTHAEWRDCLKLAEVTHQTGGYWQFFGHHRDHKLYLRPEEALFLIETNCLLLRYNEVIVSLQQAYSILLSDEISIIQYKVYATLSRLGYKIFRHLPQTTSSESKGSQSEKVVLEQNMTDKHPNKTDCKNDVTMETEIKEVILNKDVSISADIISSKGNDTENAMDSKESNSLKVESIQNKFNEEGETSSKMIIEENYPIEQNLKTANYDDSTEDTQLEKVVETNSTDIDTKQIENIKLPETAAQTQETDTDTVMESENVETASANTTPQPTNMVSEEHNKETNDDVNTSEPNNTQINIDPLTKYCKWKLDKLKERRSKNVPILDIHDSFKECPDISQNQIITIKTPKEEYLPKNVFINNLQYVINVENISSKSVVRAASTGSTYSLSDEVNGAHIRRVTNAAIQIHAPTRPPANIHQNNCLPPFFPSFRPATPLRHYNYWRPRHPMNYFQFNLFYQRPFMSNFNPRFQFYPRMHMPMFPRPTEPHMNFTVNNEFGDSSRSNRKRPKDSRSNTHLENIKKLAQKLRNVLILPGINRSQNIHALQSLIEAYNERFKPRIRLTQQYEIVFIDNIVDTITLDDEDDESKAKKPRQDDESGAKKTDLFMENLNMIRRTALKLKKLESEDKTSTRHRRALSGLIKTFNKHFNADIYLTENNDIHDRRFINLDSSSDSDCVIEEVPKVKTGKKLRNPFNLLKKLSEKQMSSSSASTSRQNVSEPPVDQNTCDSHEVLQKYFKKPWLPGVNDFGKPEVISRDAMTARLVETKKEEFLFEFMKDQSHIFNNWVDLKIAFLKSIEETNAILNAGEMFETHIDIKCLVNPEDCTDMETVLNKLSIIKNNKNIRSESTISIDFDVYERDVKNFRKTSRPKPHFRIVCIDESSASLTGLDIATLHHNVKDEVAVLFAVVGSSSISFIQMNPKDSPVYIPCNEMG